jgi:hypothetical protein
MNFSTDTRDFMGTRRVYVFAFANSPRKTICSCSHRPVDDISIDLLNLIPAMEDGTGGLSPLPDDPLMHEMTREAVVDMLDGIRSSMELIPELEAYLAVPTDAPALFGGYSDEVAS